MRVRAEVLDDRGISRPLRIGSHSQEVNITFDVIGIPQPQGSLRCFCRNGRAVVTSDNPKLKEWKKHVKEVAMQFAPRYPMEGPLSVELDFRMPVPKSAPKRTKLFAVKRPDIDKISRGAIDPMTGVIFRDDSQIVVLKATKYLAYENFQGVSIRVSHVEDWLNE